MSCLAAVNTPGCTFPYCNRQGCFPSQVAESEETLVQRLVERKSEALVRTPGHGSSPGLWYWKG